MRASRSDTRVASQSIECMHAHVSMWRTHILTDVVMVLLQELDAMNRVMYTGGVVHFL